MAKRQHGTIEQQIGVSRFSNLIPFPTVLGPSPALTARDCTMSRADATDAFSASACTRSKNLTEVLHMHCGHLQVMYYHAQSTIPRPIPYFLTGPTASTRLCICADSTHTHNFRSLQQLCSVISQKCYHPHGLKDNTHVPVILRISTASEGVESDSSSAWGKNTSLSKGLVRNLQRVLVR